MNENAHKNTYIAGFQGLKGYAIALIFLSHFPFGLNVWGINLTSWWGALGVEIFIIISGYLLMEHHFDEGIEFKPYVIKRVKKFYPLHMITLFMALPLSVIMLLKLNREAWLALPLNGLLLQSWIPDQSVYFSYNAVSWYLSVLLFLTIISPLVIRVYKKLTYKKTIVVCLILVSLEFLWSFISMESDNSHWLIYIFPIARALDYFIGGGLWKIVQYCNNWKHQTNYSLLGLGTILLILFLAIFSMGQGSNWFLVCVWVIPVSLIIIITAMGKERCFQVLFENRIAKVIGSFSLEIFLFHQLVIKYCDIINNHLFGFNKSIVFLIDIILTLTVIFVWRKMYQSIMVHK